MSYASVLRWRTTMATISIRVPDDLKRRMDSHDVNWSDLLRDAIEERLLRMQREAAARRMDERADAIFRRTRKHSTLSDEVIKWRRLH